MSIKLVEVERIFKDGGADAIRDRRIQIIEEALKSAVNEKQNEEQLKELKDKLTELSARLDQTNRKAELTADLLVRIKRLEEVKVTPVTDGKGQTKEVKSASFREILIKLLQK